MSEQERDERMNEAIALLSRLSPERLSVDRDRLFFRAGEASARGELQANPRAGRWLWPAAAAVLAVIAAGLSAVLVNREPEVQVVYVRRAADGPRDEADSAANNALPGQSQNKDAMEIRPAGRTAIDQIRRDLPTDDLIHRQDWAALSDAFAQQMRLQQERSQAARNALLTTAAGNGDGELPRGDVPRQRARTYLELRDSMQAM